MLKFINLLANTTLTIFTYALIGSSSAVATLNAEPQQQPYAINVTAAGKLGLAWALGDNPALKGVVTQNTAFIYTWSSWKPQPASSLSIEFIPMLWGKDHVTEFRNNIKGLIFIIRPDHPGQSNMSPQQAAQIWRQVLEPYCRGGAFCISPATTSAPSGFQWVQNFLAQCNGCKIDAIAIHWYGTKSSEFINYVRDASRRFSKPIYVTEYACTSFTGGPQCTQDQAVSFHRDVVRFMNSDSNVRGYFPFAWVNDMSGVAESNRLISNGQPTALGRRYINNNW